jgi:hypothetical protein
MNIFRLLGDLSHLASIFILIHKITTSRSARGISFKSQLVYLVVFLTRHVPAAPSPPSSVPNLTDPSRLQVSRLADRTMDLALQHRHEDLFHLVLRLPPLPHQVKVPVSLDDVWCGTPVKTGTNRPLRVNQTITRPGD